MEIISDFAVSLMQMPGRAVTGGTHLLTTLFHTTVDATSSLRESRAFIPVLIGGGVAITALVVLVGRRYFSASVVKTKPDEPQKTFKQKLEEALGSEKRDEALAQLKQSSDWNEEEVVALLKKQTDAQAAFSLFKTLSDTAAVAFLKGNTVDWVMYYLAGDTQRNWNQLTDTGFWHSFDYNHLQADDNACRVIAKLNDPLVTNILAKATPAVVGPLLNKCQRSWKGVFPQGYWDNQETVKTIFPVYSGQTRHAFEQLSSQDAMSILVTSCKIKLGGKSMRASLKKKLNVARLPTFEQFLFGTNHDWTTVNLIGYDPKNLACSYVSDLKNFEQLSVTARVANLTSKNDVSLQLFLIAKSLTTDWTKQSLSKSFLASLFDYGRNDPFAYVRAFSRLSDSQKIATLIGLNSTNRYAQCACYIAESITSWTEVELGEVLTQPMVVETYRRNTDTWDQMFDRLSKKNAIEALSHLTLDEIKAIIGKSQFVWTDQQLRELEQKKGLVGTYTPIRDCARQWGKLTTP